MKNRIAEFAEWRGVNTQEATDIINRAAHCAEAWESRKDIYDFHKNTYYFISALLSWETTTKYNYSDAIVAFAKTWPHYPIKTFMDHGSGIGYDAIRMIQEAGCDVYLYELDSPHLDFAIWRLKKRNLWDKVKGVLIVTEGNPMPDYPLVDFTSSIAVIEHLEYPQRDLKHILDRTRYVAIRVDPMVEKGNSSPTHFDTNVEFLVKLNGQDPDLLNELGIKRINSACIPIYEVTRNVPPEFRVNKFIQNGSKDSGMVEYIWSKE